MDYSLELRVSVWEPEVPPTAPTSAQFPHGVRRTPLLILLANAAGEQMSPESGGLALVDPHAVKGLALRDGLRQEE